MKIRIRYIIVFLYLILLTNFIFSQEAIKSVEEEYYDFLSLTGLVERPTLGYRTLSDSVWKFSEVPDVEGNNHIWENNNLGTTFTLWQPSSPASNWFAKGLFQGLTARIYGPEWFNSYNTAAPYGQNDGALWQGRGYNTVLTAGLRLEGYGFEVTVRPQVSWMENREFEYIKPNYAGSNFTGKADTYGYYGVRSIDAPQRFGDSSFWNFDWGDTEVRFTWNTLTFGFGTQTIWLGPAKLNPIIHSNNAASYPKFDIGFRKTKLTMPHFGWNLGYLEGRGWWGKLSESEWFDNDETNNDNLITGLALYYQFPFFNEFTIGLNRTMLSKWDNISTYSLFNIFNPLLKSGSSGGSDKSDQRVSICFDYNLTKVGFKAYFEWARNDYSPSFDYYLRYPFHTQGWTFGAVKQFSFSNKIQGELILELTHLECSADYDRLIGWSSTFYAHHKVTQGYTTKGQWLGAGIGTGGNSQYLGLRLYNPKGQITIFAQRRNPDLDYTMYIDSKNQKDDFNNNKWTAEANIRALISLGITSSYFINNSFEISPEFIFIDEHNPLNDSKGKFSSENRYNFNFTLQLGWSF